MRVPSKCSRSPLQLGNVCNAGNPHPRLHTEHKQDEITTISLRMLLIGEGPIAMWMRTCWLEDPLFASLGRQKKAERSIARVHSTIDEEGFGALTILQNITT